MHTAKNKTAVQLFARMTEVEKIKVRHATNMDRVEHLRQNYFRSDGISEAEMQKVKIMVDAAFAENSKSNVFGRTWMF
jgi:hypothetical protein